MIQTLAKANFAAQLDQERREARIQLIAALMNTMFDTERSNPRRIDPQRGELPSVTMPVIKLEEERINAIILAADLMMFTLDRLGQWDMPTILDRIANPVRRKAPAPQPDPAREAGAPTPADEEKTAPTHVTVGDIPFRVYPTKQHPVTAIERRLEQVKAEMLGEVLDKKVKSKELELEYARLQLALAALKDPEAPVQVPRREAIPGPVHPEGSTSEGSDNEEHS